MNVRTIITTIILSCLAIVAGSQNPLNSGFELLETGQFEEAKTFFSQYLNENPDDRTARLCYGRALGLSGETDEAIILFNNLEQQYPADREISLNKAEAFLWAKRYPEAVLAYKDLYVQDSTGFAVTLGYANALSSVKDYSQALIFIDRALSINFNQQALISKKYILLGLSQQWKNKGSLEKAHLCLDTLEAIFPGDREGMLSRAVLHLLAQEYKAAKKVYEDLLLSGADTLESCLGISYVNMVLQKSKTGLPYSEMALNKALATGDSASILRAALNQINLYGGNKRFKEAYDKIDVWEKEFGKVLPLMLARPRLLLWEGKYDASVAGYRDLQGLYPDSYELLVGLAESLYAQKKNDAALAGLQMALDLDPGRPDAKLLMQQIESGDRPSFRLTGGYMHDNGGSQSYETEAGYEFARTGSFRPLLRFGYKKTSQDGEGTGAERFRMGGGLQWEPSHRIRLTALAGTVFYPAGQTADKANFLGKLDMKYKLNPRQNLGLQIDKTIYDYNSELVRSGLGMTRFSTNYFATLPSGWGTYAQAGLAKYTDKNQNWWMFLSVFYQIKDAPVVKAGINYSRMGFQEVGKALYFSPNSFQSVEAFVQFNKQAQHFQRLSLQAELGLGIQQIETSDWQSTYRWTLGASWKFTDLLTIEGNMRGSNAADATAAGYSYVGIELGLRYRFINK